MMLGAGLCECPTGSFLEGQTCVALPHIVLIEQLSIEMSEREVEKETDIVAATNINQVVPFMTTRSNALPGAPTRSHVDVYIDGEKLIVERGLDGQGATTTSIVHLVEFSEEIATVKSAVFTIEPDRTEATANPTTFDKNSFLVFYSQTTESNLGASMVRGEISNRRLKFTREKAVGTNASNGTITGHWFVITSRNNSFKVKFDPRKIDPDTATVSFGKNQANSILLWSNSSTEDSVKSSHIVCSDFNNTQACTRSGKEGVVSVVLQTIKFKTSIAAKMHRLEIEPRGFKDNGTEALPMVFSGQIGVAGAVKYTGGSNGLATIKKTDDGIEMQRGTEFGTSVGVYQNMPFIQ